MKKKRSNELQAVVVAAAADSFLGGSKSRPPRTTELLAAHSSPPIYGAVLRKISTIDPADSRKFFHIPTSLASDGDWAARQRVNWKRWAAVLAFIDKPLTRSLLARIWFGFYDVELRAAVSRQQNYNAAEGWKFGKFDGKSKSFNWIQIHFRPFYQENLSNWKSGLHPAFHHFATLKLWLEFFRPSDNSIETPFLRNAHLLWKLWFKYQSGSCWFKILTLLPF